MKKHSKKQKLAISIDRAKRRAARAARLNADFSENDTSPIVVFFFCAGSAEKDAFSRYVDNLVEG